MGKGYEGLTEEEYKKIFHMLPPREIRDRVKNSIKITLFLAKDISKNFPCINEKYNPIYHLADDQENYNISDKLYSNLIDYLLSFRGTSTLDVFTMDTGTMLDRILYEYYNVDYNDGFAKIDTLYNSWKGVPNDFIHFKEEPDNYCFIYPFKINYYKLQGSRNWGMPINQNNIICKSNSFNSDECTLDLRSMPTDILDHYMDSFWRIKWKPAEKICLDLNIELIKVLNKTNNCLVLGNPFSPLGPKLIKSIFNESFKSNKKLHLLILDVAEIDPLLYKDDITLQYPSDRINSFNLTKIYYKKYLETIKDAINGFIDEKAKYVYDTRDWGIIDFPSWEDDYEPDSDGEDEPVRDRDYPYADVWFKEELNNLKGDSIEEVKSLLGEPDYEKKGLSLSNMATENYGREVIKCQWGVPMWDHYGRRWDGYDAYLKELYIEFYNGKASNIKIL